MTNKQPIYSLKLEPFKCNSVDTNTVQIHYPNFALNVNTFIWAYVHVFCQCLFTIWKHDQRKKKVNVVFCLCQSFIMLISIDKHLNAWQKLKL